MTHEDARTLLAPYALGALDTQVEALEAHVQGCDRCKRELADFFEASTSLGEAVREVPAPAALRAAVLSHVPERRGPFQTLAGIFATNGRLQLATAVALLVAILALGTAIVQQQQLQSVRSELALNSRGLQLLTSTEVIIERLEPVLDPTSQAHGHWYHRPGVGTQVIVVEFLPAARNGEAYYAWLRRADGVWSSPGILTLDGNGYGRLIILGGDGTDVTSVVVTRQSGPSPMPTGETILRWPSP